MSALSLERLKFDPAAVSEGPLVGSYLVGADGTVISHTNENGKDALDVHVSGQVDVTGSSVTATVTATDLDIRNLAFGTDSVDVSGSNITASVSSVDFDIRDLAFATDKVDVSGSSVSATVTATDLDIRDLAFATDKVDVSGSNISATVSATDLDIRDLAFATDKVDVSGSNISATVSATDLDIRDLLYTQDSVTSYQGGSWEVALDAASLAALENITVDVSSAVADDAADSGNPLLVGSHAFNQDAGLSAVQAGDRAYLSADLHRQLLINDACNIGMSQAAVTVGTSAVALFASPLANRKRVIIQNRGSASIFVGASGVATTDGIEVSKGGSLALEAGVACALYAISTSAGNNVRVIQLA